MRNMRNYWFSPPYLIWERLPLDFGLTVRQKQTPAHDLMGLWENLYFSHVILYTKWLNWSINLVSSSIFACVKGDMVIIIKTVSKNNVSPCSAFRSLAAKRRKRRSERALPSQCLPTATQGKPGGMHSCWKQANNHWRMVYLVRKAPGERERWEKQRQKQTERQ